MASQPPWGPQPPSPWLPPPPPPPGSPQPYLPPTFGWGGRPAWTPPPPANGKKVAIILASVLGGCCLLLFVVLVLAPFILVVLGIQHADVHVTTINHLDNSVFPNVVNDLNVV